MSNKQAVRQFLKRFKQKARTWTIIYEDDRSKNSQALLDLEITSKQRTNILLDLKTKDYCQGPKEDEFNWGSDLWVFGKTVNNTEVYIKITLGKQSRPVICISFHPAERPMDYPFKQKEG